MDQRLSGLPDTGIAIQNAGELPQDIGAADILVAIPTYNNADTIAPLLLAARSSVLQFSAYKTVILQADGGSEDATLQHAREALSGWPNLIQVSYPLYPVHKLVESSQAVPGRDSAFQTIFSVAEGLKVKTCCVVDPGMKSVSPDWIASLVQPIIESGFDFVAPQYLRHKYEGMLINGILYPMVRALFGKQIRQPIGNDFGFSGEFIHHMLSRNGWTHDVVRQAVDLWLTIEAITGRFKLCQALLGPRPQPRRDAPPELSAVLHETVGALFTHAELRAEQWQRVRGSEQVPTFGLRFEPDAEHPAMDVKPMIEKFRLGLINLQEIWGIVLSPATLLELKKMSREREDGFRFPDELWGRTIYDFTVAHRQRTIARDHLLGALVPLYLGWAASFIQNIRDSRPAAVAVRQDSVCRAFEAEKPYFISRWRWPDRFVP